MKSFRQERVANVVRAVVSEAIARRLSDPRIEPMSSVTRVEVSKDLEHVLVFISVMGDESTARRTMRGLTSATGLVQRMLARELPIRQCPHLRFELDESIKKGDQILNLIRDTMAEYDQGQAETEETGSPRDHVEGEVFGDDV